MFMDVTHFTFAPDVAIAFALLTAWYVGVGWLAARTARPHLRRVRSSRAAKGTAVLCAACAVSIAIVALPIVWASFEAATYPYNSEGRYFDGIVVHHDSSSIGWGCIGGALLFPAIACAVTALQLRRAL